MPVQQLCPRTKATADQQCPYCEEEGRTDPDAGSGADPNAGSEAGSDAGPDIDVAANGMVLLLRLVLRFMKDGDRDAPPCYAPGRSGEGQHR
jgi:hypothetical protein